MIQEYSSLQVYCAGAVLSALTLATAVTLWTSPKANLKTSDSVASASLSAVKLKLSPGIGKTEPVIVPTRAYLITRLLAARVIVKVPGMV